MTTRHYYYRLEAREIISRLEIEVRRYRIKKQKALRAAADARYAKKAAVAKKVTKKTVTKKKAKR